MITMLANQPIVDMLDRPDIRSSVVSQAIYGTPLEELKSDDNWVRLKTPDNYEGWIPREFITAVSNYTDATVVTINPAVHVYKSADIATSAPILTFPFLTKLRRAPEDQQSSELFLKIILIDGSTAWIQRGDIFQGEYRLSMEQMLDQTYKFLWLPYTWGGTSSFGYDCSGFLQNMFLTMGLTLPRDSYQQEEWAGFRSVSEDALQPGDIIFFGKTKVTHVAIYLGEMEGKQKMIHATVANDKGENFPVLQIGNLKNSYLRKLIISIKRLKHRW